MISRFTCQTFLFLTFQFVFTSTAFAQKTQATQQVEKEGFCAHQQAWQLLEKQSPQLKQLHEYIEKEVYQYFNGNKRNWFKSPADYTLPVVVHIIHDNGTENIPDAVVLQGIQDLNDAYANIGYYDPSTGVDTEIEFCIAKRDPDGNATTGINRVQSGLTEMTLETEDISMKDLSRWDPTHYINIWLVREICSNSVGCGVAGYAYFPSSHGNPEDGIVMEAEFFGSSQGASGVQVHEMGHYLGLYHTFQGGCTNNDCLADGDRVCDTPPDQSTAWIPCGSNMNSCSTDTNSGFGSDQDDLFQDYMDYSDFGCYSLFTQGQADRMQWHIENVRFSLLESQGCLDPCTSALTASFTSSATSVDAGGMINFTNTSTNTTSAEWQIEGLPFANTTDADYTFNQVGNFEICLKVGNADPNCSDKFCETIQVTCPVSASFTSGNLFPEPGENVVYFNTSQNGGTNEWSVNGVVVANSLDLTYAFPSPGIYSVCLLAGNGLCVDEICQTAFVADPPVGPVDCDTTFLKIYGTPQDSEISRAIATVPDVLGGGFLLGGGKGDSAMVTLLDPNGDVVWTRSFDATFDAADFVQDIKFDSDNNVIGSGQTKILGDNIECFAFKYDMVNDVMIWINELDLPDPAHENYYSILEKTPGGNYVVAGQTNNLVFGGTGCDGILVELNRNTGANVWQQNYHFGSCETFTKIIIADNSIYATGRYNFDGGGTARMRPGISKFDLSGNQIWSRWYLRPGGNTTARLYGWDILEDNGLLVFGQGDNNGTSATDNVLFLYKTDLDGNIEWAREYDPVGSNTERARKIVNLPDGYLCLGNHIAGDQDAFVFKVDKMGNLQWSKTYGSIGTEDAWDMVWNNGQIYFTGLSDGIGAGGSEDIYLASIGADGNSNALDTCNLFSDLEMTSAPYLNPYDGQHDLINQNQTWGFFLDFAQMSETAVQTTIACGEPCADEICDNGVDDDGDGYVDCYDTDCPCSTDDCVVNASDLDQNFATKLAWQSTVNEVSIDATPIVANLNPQVDSIPEIIVCESKASITQSLSTKILIFKGDGSNAANPQELDISQGYDGYSMVNPAVGDIDRNGIPELVMVSSDRRIRVYSFYDENNLQPMQEIIVSSDLADHRNRKPYLADFDGDGMAEVYVGDDIFQFDPGFTTLTKVLNGGSSGGLQYYRVYQEPNCSPVAMDMLSPAHCNGDPDCGGLELVAGNVIYSVDLDPNDGDGFEIKIQRNLNIMQTTFTFQDGYTSVADVDLDGILDVVVSSARNSTVGIYVWNRNGLLQWFPHPSSPEPLRSGGLPCIANVYDDTQNGALIDMPEIIVCSELKLNCYNLNAANLGMAQNAWWSLATTDLSGMTGATVFDFNGDGLEEIVYRDENNLRIMYGGTAPFPPGVDTERNWETFTAGSGTFDEHPIIADVDNDGQANIVLTSYTFPGINNPAADYRGRLRVFEADLSAGDPWLSARPIWNQYNYFVVNVNDNLSLPLQQQWHHLEFPGIGSGYRPFNKFVSQVPFLDNDYLPFLPVPDATVSADSISCGMDSVAIVLNICNEGDAVLPDITPIAFYIGDPTTTAAPLHFVSGLNADVLPGECWEQTINVPLANGVEIFIVVNDDGSAATPFNFGNDFPVTNVIECVYINNPASIFVDFSSPALDLGPDVSLCQFGVLELDAGPGFETYEWQDGSSDQTYTAWNPGTYWVKVTDQCGGIQSDTIVLMIDSTSVLDLGPDFEICEGGSHTFTLSGFDNYEWSPADFLDCSTCATVTTTPTASITYTVVASTVDGCFSADSISITLGQVIETSESIEICEGETISIFGMDVSDAGVFMETFTSQNGCDSTHTVTVTVFPAPNTNESISICEGETTDVFGTPTSTAGVYEMTFTTALGCDSIHTITLTVLDNVSTSEDISICFGETANIFGTPTGVAGTYEMTFTAANGCDSVHMINLSVANEILISVSPVQASCFGGSDGSATASASGGSGNYMYQWSNGASGAIVNGLSSGNYNLTVTDQDNGCTSSTSFEISQPTQVEAVVSAENVSCTELGNATVSASGGIPPYTYLWSTGEETTSIANLLAGTYTVTCTDANGCTDDANVEINGALGPMVSIEVESQISEDDPNSGELSAEITMGMAPFDIEWSNGENSLNIDSLSSGQYIILVTDANGCEARDTAYLYLPACTGGKIWNDTNRDGCQEGGEYGMGGVDLNLMGTDIWGNDFSASTTSAINGEYIFENLPPGDYQVELILPNGYSYSPVDACSDDFTDSDFDVNGISYTIVLVEGHCCLIVDGGLYDSCINISKPGEICCDQTLCGPGVDPDPIQSVLPAVGGFGQIMYMWMYSHDPAPFEFAAWMPVLDANGQPVMTLEYDPGPLSQTTYFARCAKASGCDDWLETGRVAIIVEAKAVALIDEPGTICVGNTLTFTASPNEPGASYYWHFGPWASPSSSNEPSPTITWNQPGYTTISLEVENNGCISKDEMQIAISNNPVYCGTAFIAPLNQSNVRSSTELAQFRLYGDKRFEVYPNPTDDELTISWQHEISSELYVNIFSVEGKVLYRKNIAENNKIFSVDISNLNSGIYFLRLYYNDGEMEAMKIVKK